ncbi:MAG: ATP synthase F1 subunit gamma [Armatimonadetes bacterium]|nr:ATP synthase F1 subunit gamma [Armatimonadota bacterium]
MPTPKAIRRRIRTVKNIQKITNAMKMVAAARLKKAQARAEAARPYARKMSELIANLAASTGAIEHPLLEAREERKVAFVVIGADRGLAGSYNVNVMHKAISAIGDREPENVKLVLVGKKAVGFFRRRPYEIVAKVEAPGSTITFGDVRRLTSQIRSMFESGQVDAVYLVYARFVTAMRQEPAVVRLLPMEKAVTGEIANVEFEFEPEPGKLLSALLPRYVDTQVYQSLVEAQASEQGARMTAMSAATKNAGEMIDTLTLAYNKARQAAITKELTEIVGGAEALR